MKIAHWLERPRTIEEEQLIAWHHLINDPFITTFTVDENGEEYKQYYNTKLAYQRALMVLGQHINEVTHMFVKTFTPTFDALTEAFQRFGENFKDIEIDD